MSTFTMCRRALTLAAVFTALAGPLSARAGDCARYGNTVESQCLAAAKEGRVRRIGIAKKLCGDAKTYATRECKREFTALEQYYQQSIAARGYRYTRCQYWGWAAQQFVYWTYLGDEGKYTSAWDDVAGPIYDSVLDIATNACTRKL
jgi:hypothetical protein